jgi:hypothetical protein
LEFLASGELDHGLRVEGFDERVVVLAAYHDVAGQEEPDLPVDGEGLVGQRRVAGAEDEVSPMVSLFSAPPCLRGSCSTSSTRVTIMRRDQAGWESTAAAGRVFRFLRSMATAVSADGVALTLMSRGRAAGGGGLEPGRARTGLRAAARAPRARARLPGPGAPGGGGGPGRGRRGGIAGTGPAPGRSSPRASRDVRRSTPPSTRP